MEIKSLELENFKTFELETIKFKKITLLTGANSSGKTTILNALAAISQGEKSRPFPFLFNNYGENVHLGGFKDIVKGGNAGKTYSLGINFEHKGKTFYGKGEYRYASSGKQTLPNKIKIKSQDKDKDKDIADGIEVEWKGQNIGYRYEHTTSEDTKGIIKLIRNMLNEVKEKSKDQIDIYKNALNISDIDINKIDYKKTKTSKDSDIYRSILNELDLRTILKSYDSAFKELINKVYYLGPIRPYPERQYFISSYSPKIDALGKSTLQILIDWDKHNRPKINKINKDLELIGLAKSISTNFLKDDLSEVKIQPIGQNESINLSDVGFGLSQILPILVANASVENGSTMLINQPEVHLHPSSQANLANYFNQEKTNKNFIIETHSEYIINRFRLLVAKGEIKPDDISIIYVSNNEKKKKINYISIDKSGALKDAPDEFFDTYYVDSKELVLSSFGD